MGAAPPRLAAARARGAVGCRTVRRGEARGGRIDDLDHASAGRWGVYVYLRVAVRREHWLSDLRRAALAAGGIPVAASSPGPSARHQCGAGGQSTGLQPRLRGRAVRSPALAGAARWPGSARAVELVAGAAPDARNAARGGGALSPPGRMGGISGTPGASGSQLHQLSCRRRAHALRHLSGGDQRRLAAVDHDVDAVAGGAWALVRGGGRPLGDAQLLVLAAFAVAVGLVWLWRHRRPRSDATGVPPVPCKRSVPTLG